MVYTETPFCCVTLSDICGGGANCSAVGIAVVVEVVEVGRRRFFFFSLCGLGLPGHTNTLVAAAVESDKVWDLASVLQHTCLMEHKERRGLFLYNPQYFRIVVPPS